MKRACISFCLACIAFGPGCAPKSGEASAVEPNPNEEASSNGAIADEFSKGEAPAEQIDKIEKIQIAVRTHHLDVVFEQIERLSEQWTGTAIKIGELLAAMAESDSSTVIEISRPISFDAAYPQPGQQSRPEDLEVRVHLPSKDPRAFIERDGTMQPLGDGLWRRPLNDTLSLLVREDARGVTVATSMTGLDKALSEYNSAEPLDPRFQLQVEVANFPRDSIDPSALLEIGGIADSKTLSKIIQELTGLRLQLGFQQNSAVELLARASAPYESLGLSPLGPALNETSMLAATLPAKAVVSGVLSMSNARPVIREIDALLADISEVPPPFDEAIERTANALRRILNGIRGEVVFAIYLTKKRELAIVLAAQTPNADASREAIRALMLEIERVLKTHIALVGEDPDERYSASFKPDGLGFSQARADILAVDLSNAMTRELLDDDVLSKSSSVLFGKKTDRVEFLSFVEGGASLVALGPGARSVMSDYLRGRKGPRSSSLETKGGLDAAREVTGGCQLCVTLNPHELANLLVVLEDYEGGDRLKSLEKLLKKRALEVEIAVGATLDQQHASFGISLPGALVAPSRENIDLLRDLLDLGEDPQPMTTEVRSR